MDNHKDFCPDLKKIKSKHARTELQKKVSEIECKVSSGTLGAWTYLPSNLNSGAENSIMAKNMVRLLFKAEWCALEKEVELMSCRDFGMGANFMDQLVLMQLLKGLQTYQR